MTPNSAKIIMQRGQVKVAPSEVSSEACDDRAVGHTVTKIACGGDATGFKQLSLFELVGSQRDKNLPLNCVSN